MDHQVSKGRSNSPEGVVNPLYESSLQCIRDPSADKQDVTESSGGKVAELSRRRRRGSQKVKVCYICDMFVGN